MEVEGAGERSEGGEERRRGARVALERLVEEAVRREHRRCEVWEMIRGVGGVYVYIYMYM